MDPFCLAVGGVVEFPVMSECPWSLSVLQQEGNRGTAIWRKPRGGACVDTRQANKDVVAHALSISAAEPSLPVSLLGMSSSIHVPFECTARAIFQRSCVLHDIRLTAHDMHITQ